MKFAEFLRTSSVVLLALTLTVAPVPTAYASPTAVAQSGYNVTYTPYTGATYTRNQAQAQIERRVYDFLKHEMNFNDATAIGILANIYAECSFDPTTVYVEADGAVSFGICQWNKGRRINLEAFCQKNGYAVTDLEGQLRFMQYELTEGEEKNAYRYMQGISNDIDGAYTAGLYWARYYERCSRHEPRAVLARDTFWKIYGRYIKVGLNVPYYPVTDGFDARHAAIAMCEGIYKGYYTSDSAVTAAVASADLSGYAEKEVVLDDIYTYISRGEPVIVSDGAKYSVVFAYDGNPNRLDAAGFRTVTPTRSAFADGSYDRLDVYLKYHPNAKLLVRTSDSVGLGVKTVGSRLSVQNWSCPVNIPKGQAFPMHGFVTSSYDVGYVMLTLNVGDETVRKYTVDDNKGNFFDISSLNSRIDFSTLDAGTYTLKLYAQDANKAVITSEQTITVSDMPISGKLVTDYAATVGNVNNPLLGNYRIIAPSGLNVRATPSTSGTKLTALRYGTEVKVTEVTEDGWGKIAYDAYTGWISMEYAEFVSANCTVSYYTELGSGAPDTQIKDIGVSLKLSENTPSCLGYDFVGWSKNSNAQSADYQPGELYELNVSLNLYAVWHKVETEKLCGDVNMDGKVNMKDLSLLQQYIGGWQVSVDDSMTDVNNDGVHDQKDLDLLWQYICGDIDI